MLLLWYTSNNDKFALIWRFYVFVWKYVFVFMFCLVPLWNMCWYAIWLQTFFSLWDLSMWEMCFMSSLWNMFVEYYWQRGCNTAVCLSLHLLHIVVLFFTMFNCFCYCLDYVELLLFACKLLGKNNTAYHFLLIQLTFVCCCCFSLQ